MGGKTTVSLSIWKGELSIGSEYVNIGRSDNYMNKDLAGFSSMVDIAEQNLAFFTQYRVETKLGNFAAGVRYENADYIYRINDLKDNDKSRRYGQWFPNLSYSKRFGEVMMQLNYNSRVTRPTYTELSNNLFYGNRFTIQTGNPYLKPTISNDVSLMGIWKFIQTQVSYTHQRDAIVMWIDRYKPDPKISVINYKNISELPKLSAVIVVAPVFGVYKPQLTAGVQKFWHDYTEYGLDIDMREPLYFVSLVNTFELSNHIVLNFDATYTSKGYGSTMYSNRHALKLDFGISKFFFSKSLQLKLALSDITNQGQSIKTVMPQLELINTYKFDNRQGSLTLRYFFNSASSKYKGKGAGEGAKSRF